MSGAEGGDPRNRREFPRAPIELKVEYKKLNTFFADYTKNICQGGTFIKTRKPLAVGTEFVFKLVVPKLEQELALRGEVRWVVKEGEPPPPGIDPDHEPGMGIRFIYSVGSQRSEFEGVVETLMSDSLGPDLTGKLLNKALKH